MPLKDFRNKDGTPLHKFINGIAKDSGTTPSFKYIIEDDETGNYEIEIIDFMTLKAISKQPATGSETL